MTFDIRIPLPFIVPTVDGKKPAPLEMPKNSGLDTGIKGTFGAS